MLSPLASDRPLEERTRVEMLQTVARLDRLNDQLVNASTELLETIRGARVEITPSEAAATRSEVLRLQRDYRGSCVRIDLPLELD